MLRDRKQVGPACAANIHLQAVADPGSLESPVARTEQPSSSERDDDGGDGAADSACDVNVHSVRRSAGLHFRFL